MPIRTTAVYSANRLFLPEDRPVGWWLSASGHDSVRGGWQPAGPGTLSLRIQKVVDYIHHICRGPSCVAVVVGRRNREPCKRGGCVLVSLMQEHRRHRAVTSQVPGFTGHRLPSVLHLCSTFCSMSPLIVQEMLCSSLFLNRALRVTLPPAESVQVRSRVVREPETKRR
jgi:hypothetical protein